MRRLTCWGWLVVLLGWGCGGSRAADRPPLAELGRSVKMKILVDKVMQPENGWVTEEWMVKEAAEAGFNVFSPRRGYEDLDAVRQVTAWCRKYGIWHQPWMRGVQDVPADRSLSDGKRIVWANGAEQPIWSPNADELWDWMASYIVEYAKISAQDETLMGVFLDYENYWPGKQGNLYELSYDDVIMKKFAAAKQLTLPELALDQRAPWLAAQGLSEAFNDFQVDWWRQECRALRQKVDAVNPKFQFNIYPAPGTKFMLEACYPEWATGQAPLILADPWTYGRPGPYTSHATALKTNRTILERGMAQAAETGIHRTYIAGIDPVVQGADPEFSGKNALLLSGLCDGYWIFYEGPKYKEDHPDYFKWFAWANRLMDANDFGAALAPRETEDPWGVPKIAVDGTAPHRDAPRDYPPLRFRGSNALLVSANAGQTVRLELQTIAVGHNNIPATWTAQSPAGEVLAEGETGLGAGQTIEFTAPVEGIYALMVDTGGAAFQVNRSSAPLAVHLNRATHFIDAGPRLYFRVPAGLDQFTLTGKGGGGVELLKITVSDPTGAEVAKGQATLTANSFTLPVTVGDQGGKVWSLTIDKADEGVIEDNYIGFDEKLSPTLSFFEDEVFTVKAKKP